MKKIYLLLITAVAPLLTDCTSECGYGTQMVGRNLAITGPSGSAAGVATINLGSIQDQRMYALTSQRVTDLVQQMQVCCQAKVQALKQHDQATANQWSQMELKAFDQMLDLQKQLPSSNQPSGVAPAPWGTTPKAPETAAAKTPAAEAAKPAPTTATAKASPAPTTATAKAKPAAKASKQKVSKWLTKSKPVLRDLQKKTAVSATGAPAQ